MKLLYVFTVLVAAIFTAACSSIKVDYDYDPDVDFSEYKTFRWYQGKPVPGDELVMYPNIRKRFIQTTTEQLSTKGLSLVESTGADIVAVIHAAKQDRMQMTEFGGYSWYDPWWGPYSGRVDVSYYEAGTVVIDLVEAESKKLVWRGLATGIIQRHDSPAKMKEAVDNIVTKIIQWYPPD